MMATSSAVGSSTAWKFESYPPPTPSYRIYTNSPHLYKSRNVIPPCISYRGIEDLIKGFFF